MIKNIGNRILGFLDNGWTTLGAAVIAAFIGLLMPEVGRALRPFSTMFLTLISISIIPIIFSSVTASVIKLMDGENNNIHIVRVISMFIGALVIASVIGIICSLVFNPAEEVGNSRLIANMIFQDMQKSISVISPEEALSSLQKFNFIDFLTTLVPKNPFQAFADGNVIQILSVSILVGITIATLGGKKIVSTLNFLSVLMDSFKAILKIPAKVLPIGICFLLASSLSEISLDVLVSMKSFCFGAMVCFLIIIIVSGVILLLRSPIGIIDSIKALKEPITVAFSTCSNQATLPFLTSTLVSKFKLPSDSVDLCIPLGVTMCRVSNAAYYAFITIFISSLYNEPLSPWQYEFVIVGAILTSLAASGTTGVLAIAMMSIILDPLNLPIGSISIILVVVDPIIDPFRTITSLVMNAALSCAVINNKSYRKQKHSEPT
ncbi:MAG: dicarboxylate/amino acid:cation symporter [Holosporales bacterium]|jgi:proton glutamate symport protein|nr:dicarboxylate/amino acid:cation symporter [Holosporales bacterium]